MDTSKIYFFGYGANRDASKISKVLGKVPPFHFGAILENYSLFYQTLEQIPDPPKKILESAWGPAFKAYTLNPGQGIVAGIVWELEASDLQIIKDWEFDGIWREIIQVKVKSFDGKEIEAVTEKAIKSDLNSGFYDGLNYPNNLNMNQHLVTTMEQANEDLYRVEQLKKLRSELLSVPQTTIS